MKATGSQHGVRTSETRHFFCRTAFTSNSFIKFRFPLKISSRARSTYLDPSLLYFFVLLCREDAVAMMDNSTLYFRIQYGHFFRPGQRRIASGRTSQPRQRGSDPCDPGPVGEASWRRRTGRATFRVPGASALRVVSSQIANDRLSLSLSLKLSFPAQSFVSRLKYRLALVHHIWIRPFLFFVLSCRGDAVAMVNNNTPNFGMTVRFSRPKCRKNDHDRECVKALPEV